jgi:hypothetical protein
VVRLLWSGSVSRMLSISPDPRDYESSLIPVWKSHHTSNSFNSLAQNTLQAIIPNSTSLCPRIYKLENKTVEGRAYPKAHPKTRYAGGNPRIVRCTRQPIIVQAIPGSWRSEYGVTLQFSSLSRITDKEIEFHMSES